MSDETKPIENPAMGPWTNHDELPDGWESGRNATTIQLSPFGPVFTRGEYVGMGGTSFYHQGGYRIIYHRQSETTLGIRRVHRRRVVEWLRARWEDRIAWPIADWRAKDG